MSIILRLVDDTRKAEWVFVLWIFLSFGASFGLLVWCTSYYLRVEDGLDMLSHMVTFVFLGMLLPLYAGVGLYAWISPAGWQRVATLRQNWRARRATQRPRRSPEA